VVGSTISHYRILKKIGKVDLSARPMKLKP